MMQRIFSDENEPFWRSAKPLELGVIAPALFRGFIADRFRGTGRNVDERVVDRVLAVTGGHPYATQELCYFLWEETPEGERASMERFEAAVTKVLRSEHAHFSLVWARAATAQRLLLLALAVDPGRPLRNDYRVRHQLPTASSVQRALEALVRDELVARDENGDYRIAEPFLAEWVVLNER